MEYQIIQEWVLPESSNLRANELYFRRSAEVTYDRENRSVRVPEGQYVDFSTYFNGYFLNQWKKYTRYENLRIRIHSKGNLIWNLCAGYSGKKEECLRISKDPEIEWGAIDLPQEWISEKPILCYLAAEGGEGGGEILDLILEGTLEEGAQRVVPALVLGEWRDLLLLKKNVEELLEKKREFADFPEIYLADPEGRAQTYLEERGLEVQELHFLRPESEKGMWSGFKAGIQKVLELQQECTHAILMKGDAQLPPTVLHRTVTVLQGLKKGYWGRELAGALLEIDRPWMQAGSGCFWNQGEPFFLHREEELRDVDVLVKNCVLKKSEYGGWWYCCIPLRMVKRRGLPLPLRMEEASAEYGLRLGGAISFPGIGVWDNSSEVQFPQMREYERIRNAAIVNAFCYTLRDWGKHEFAKLLEKSVQENLRKGIYEYAMLNLLGARDFLRGGAWLTYTDSKQILQDKEEKLPILQSYEELERLLTDEVVEAWIEEARSLSPKKKVLYRDAQGNCLFTEKNSARTKAYQRQLHKMQQKIDEYFLRAAQSFARFS